MMSLLLSSFCALSTPSFAQKVTDRSIEALVSELQQLKPGAYPRTLCAGERTCRLGISNSPLNGELLVHFSSASSDCLFPSTSVRVQVATDKNEIRIGNSQISIHFPHSKSVVPTAHGQVRILNGRMTSGDLSSEKILCVQEILSSKL